MEKRLVLALALSGLVLVVFSMFEQKPVVKQESRGLINQAPTYLDSSGKEFVVETDVLRIVYSERGGWIKNLFLKEYKSNKGNEIDLISGDGSGGLWFNSEVFNRQDFKISCSEIGAGNKEVELSALYPNGLEIKKSFVFTPHEYNFKFFVEFINHTNQEILLDSLYLQWGPGIREEENSKQEHGLYSVVNVNCGVELKRIKEAKLKEPLNMQGEIKWFGLNSKYFLTALVPSEEESNVQIQKTVDKGIEIGLDVSGVVAPNSRRQVSADIFTGPKKYSLLKRQGNGLEKNIDFGFFSYLSIGLLFILNGINRIAANYGIAIVLLTLVVKIVLAPMTKKGFVSMQKMQKIQPEIEKLRKKHKDNPKGLNVEMLQLYRERKINPFGGILPMIVQIPIFWALFNTLRMTIELRQAKFFWWINDLSQPDTICHLPFHLPIIGNNVNLLPIIMVITQVIQQNMMPAGVKSTEQKLMFYAMPVIFAVMFYNFPSGLVLYWTLNNVFTIVQQYFLMSNE